MNMSPACTPPVHAPVLQVVIKIKNVYGNDLIYPICQNAQRFASLAGTKTLSPRNISDIRALGFTVVQSTLPALNLAAA